MKNLELWGSLPVFALLALLLISCGGQSPGVLTDKDKKAFDNASGEVKQMWTVALEADRTNDFIGADTMLTELMRQDLTPEQSQAAEKQRVAARLHLQTAVEKGDADAQKALKELQINSRRPRNVAQ